LFDCEVPLAPDPSSWKKQMHRRFTSLAKYPLTNEYIGRISTAHIWHRWSHWAWTVKSMTLPHTIPYFHADKRVSLVQNANRGRQKWLPEGPGSKIERTFTAFKEVAALGCRQKVIDPVMQIVSLQTKSGPLVFFFPNLGCRGVGLRALCYRAFVFYNTMRLDENSGWSKCL
jgi:hypothetical protein